MLPFKDSVPHSREEKKKMSMANCDHEKTVVISPTTNEWSQSQLNEKTTLMASIPKNNLMDNPSSHVQDLSHSQNHQNQQQPPLKCPRCDSSNTKFCYYNNYSLSQPRHFCKACKRYWTRGGTLRNVPVGGGCRKNKRVKRAASSGGGGGGGEGSCSASSSANIINPNNPQPLIDVSSASNHINHLFYGLPTNPSEMNLTFPGRISAGFQHHQDLLQPQLDSLGLGFSSSSSSSTLMSLSTTTAGSERPHYVAGFTSSNSLLSSYSSIFGSASATASPTMATLLASSFHRQKFQNGGATRGVKQFQGLTSLELQQQMSSMSNGNEVSMKEEKVGGGVGENRLESNMNNQIDQIGGFTSDPSSIYWNTASNTSVGPWHDPTNIGSSVTSLI